MSINDPSAGPPEEEKEQAAAEATVEEPDTTVAEAADEPQEVGELAARVETLEAENERLRNAVAAAQRRRYRYTAVGLGALGTLAVLGAALFPTIQTVLIALGGTGIFGGLLTYFLTPERFVAASVGERIYGTLADNEAAIVADLDLQGDPVVVPASGSAAPARLFVPEVTETDVPDAAELRAPFVTGETNGLAVEPTGTALYESLADAAGTLPDNAASIAATVGDALVEQFELVDGVDIDTDEEGRVTMAIDGSAYGAVDRFDHPVASLLATTLAVELETAVSVDVESADRVDWLVICRLDT
jgi:hypothetical protein